MQNVTTGWRSFYKDNEIPVSSDAEHLLHCLYLRIQFLWFRHILPLPSKQVTCHAWTISMTTWQLQTKRPSGTVSQLEFLFSRSRHITTKSAPEIKGCRRVSQLVSLVKPAIGTAAPPGSAMQRAPKEAHFPCRTWVLSLDKALLVPQPFLLKNTVTWHQKFRTYASPINSRKPLMWGSEVSDPQISRGRQRGENTTRSPKARSWVLVETRACHSKRIP